MNKSILSLNGNRAMNYLLQTILEKEYRFVPISDVFQVIHQLKINRNVSCLIIDTDFHSQQNWELIDHIKSSKLYQIPIILLATENTELLREKCFMYEVDEIFFKPFNPLDLIDAIRTTVPASVIH